MNKVGHNSKTKAGGVAVDQLKSIIGRVEKLEEEKAGIAADIRDVFAEAKGNGFDVKAIRTIIKMRKMDASEREEQETTLDVYLNALGMLAHQNDLFDAETGEVKEAEPDELYGQAVEAVKNENKASVSFVQRFLGIGYNRAASLIERMEREGVVGPANHVGKREVLEPAEEAV